MFIITSVCFCSPRMIFVVNGTKMNMKIWPRNDSQKRERKKMVSKTMLNLSFIYIYVCMYVCIYMYMYMCIYIYIYIYIFIFIFILGVLRELHLDCNKIGSANNSSSKKIISSSISYVIHLFRSPGKPVPPVKRELLRHRDYKVDLESKLGKTIVISKTTPQAEMGGWVPAIQWLY